MGTDGATCWLEVYDNSLYTGAHCCRKFQVRLMALPLRLRYRKRFGEPVTTERSSTRSALKGLSLPGLMDAKAEHVS
jgi:hypothetical protein